MEIVETENFLSSATRVANASGSRNEDGSFSLAGTIGLDSLPPSLLTSMEEDDDVNISSVLSSLLLLQLSGVGGASTISLNNTSDST